MILHTFLLALGFFLLVKGADYLIEGTSSIAERFKVPQIIIGLTVVAFGTSMPELAIGISSSIEGSTDLSIANVVGSNISNILLILGSSCLIYRIKIDRDILKEQLPLSIFAGFLVIAMGVSKLFVKDALFLSTIDGLILVAALVIFIFRAYGKAKMHKEYKDYDILCETGDHLSKSIFLTIIGIIGLILGGKFVVESSVNIATTLGISETLIGLTIIAVGTSLPELITSIVAGYKKKTDLAVGNIIGSNIFNIFGVLGISAVITPIAMSQEIMQDILIMIAISILTFLIAMNAKNHIINKKTGTLFLILYVMYLAFITLR